MWCFVFLLQCKRWCFVFLFSYSLKQTPQSLVHVGAAGPFIQARNSVPDEQCLCKENCQGMHRSLDVLEVGGTGFFGHMVVSLGFWAFILSPSDFQPSETFRSQLLHNVLASCLRCVCFMPNARGTLQRLTCRCCRTKMSISTDIHTEQEGKFPGTRGPPACP